MPPERLPASRSVRTLAASVAVPAAVAAACTSSSGQTRAAPSGQSAPAPSPALPAGAHKIEHVVVIMQENRSFDHYFGTYPGADGIPMKDGVPTVCVDNPATGECVKPFHDPRPVVLGGPHDVWAARAHIDGGKMDGFIKSHLARLHCLGDGKKPADSCPEEIEKPNVMGWKDARDIPNYWDYAHDFVLQDHMFEPNLGASIPAHVAMVSGWSALCSNPHDVHTCVPNLVNPDKVDADYPTFPSFAWTDVTYLLHAHGVSWRYYIVPGFPPDCDDGRLPCTNDPPHVSLGAPGTPELWSPLPDFKTVHEDGEVGNVTTVAHFYEAARAGTLPAVSWVTPDWKRSEHPSGTPGAGQAWTTGLINAVMNGPNWDSTAIFVAWDDWGGFYDHVSPPKVDDDGYGIRVPGLLISPYAKKGYIDHQTLSFDAYLKFIEDLFLNGERIDPRTDGRWDPRPNVREAMPQLGNLFEEFDFSQPPRRPVELPLYPPPGPASIPGT